MKPLIKEMLSNNGITLVAHLVISFVIYLLSSFLDDAFSSVSMAVTIQALIGVIMFIAYFWAGKRLLRNRGHHWSNLASVLIIPILGVGFFSRAGAWGVFFYGFMAPWIYLSTDLKHAWPYVPLDPPISNSVIITLCLYSLIPAVLIWWGMQKKKRQLPQ